MDPIEARHYVVEGLVQGVGFRYFTMRTGRELRLAGWVRNLPDGRVEAKAAGPVRSLEAFEARLHQGPPASEVSQVWCTPLPREEAASLPAEFAVGF